MISDKLFSATLSNSFVVTPGFISFAISANPWQANYCTEQLYFIFSFKKYHSSKINMQPLYYTSF